MTDAAFVAAGSDGVQMSESRHEVKHRPPGVFADDETPSAAVAVARRGAMSGAPAGLGLAALAVAAGAVPAGAASPSPPPSGHGLPEPAPQQPGGNASQDEKWRRRFPQPVLVSDLIGRKMLDQAQGTLGRIETLVTKPDGEILIAFARRRFLFFDGEVVVVPAKAAALLGYFVMILDLSAEEIDGLPAFSAQGTSEVDRSSRILMALTKH